VSVAAAQEAAQPQQAAQAFDIEAFDVSGVTRFTPDQIAAIVYPFAGPSRGSDDVEAARKAIQDAYAKRGFEAVVVEIPVQPTETFRHGIVLLSVAEAPLGRVIVSGEKYHSADRVRADVPSLVPGQPIDLAGLQRDVASANRFPDRTITPTFKPAANGSVDVELKVKDERPIHASVEVNNDNSPSTTRTRVQASGRLTNLWGEGHTLSATYIVAPERRDDSEVISGSYSIPYIGTPWTFLFFGYKSNSNIAALGGTNVLGDGYQVGFRVSYKLPSDTTYQSISFGPDFKDFKQDISIAGVNAGRAPIRYLPLTAEYSLSGTDETQSYGFTLGGTFGLRAIKRYVRIDGCTVTSQNNCLVDQFQNREVDARENFVHLNLTADYSRAFSGDFVGAYHASAQYADSHLITNEQFATGGLTSVRGYYLSEAVGDNGFAQQFEFRSPSAATLFGSAVDELRVYGFFDMGYVHVLRALAEQQSDFRLMSVGGGARLRLLGAFSGEMSIGVPLRDGPVSVAGDPRAVFIVRGEF
jgi:hemolysin activation/secretion protein